MTVRPLALDRELDSKPPVLGSKLIIFGHSFTTGGGASHADRQYGTLLTGMLRSDPVALGVGGAVLGHDEKWLGATDSRGGWAWVLQQTVPYGSSAPYAPDGFLPYLHFGGNDITHHSQDASGEQRTVWKNALRTAMSRLCAARVFEDSDATVVFSGTNGWKPALPMTWRNSGVSYRPLLTNGAVFTITIPADFEGGTIAVGLVGFPAGDGTITWSGTCTGATGTTSLAGQAHKNGGTLNRRDSSIGIVKRFTGLTAADAGDTIIGTYGSGAATRFSTAPTITGITKTGTGSTTYGYKRVYRTYAGDTIPGGEGTITLQNATLSGSAFNNIPAGAAWPAGVEFELILRTSATGASGPGAGLGFIAILRNGPAIVVDNGLPAAAYTAETVNPLTGGGAFDYWQIESNNPVTRGVIIKVNRWITYANGTDAGDVTDYNADIDTVVAEFGANQWVTVDVDGVLAADTANFSSDGVHPNDRGHALTAAAVYAALSTWGASLPGNEVAILSRVSKRVTSRQTMLSVWSGDLSLPPGRFRTPLGTIAAASLPNVADGTADYSLDTTARVIDTTNLSRALNASIGDDIEVDIALLAGPHSSGTFNMDVAFLAANGSVIRYFAALPSTPTTFGLFGWPAWFLGGTSAASTQVTGKAFATVTAADLITLFTVPGQIFVALVAKVASGTGSIFAGGSSVSPPAVFSLRNMGRTNQGFNGS